MSRAEPRRDAIRQILARHTVATQDQLRRHLAARGIRVAQATLSRDMALLGVRRVVRAGGARYEMNGDAGQVPLDPVRRLVESIATNGVTVVVKTKAGAASTVARALDEAGLRSAMGTLAGDDTIFVAPVSPRGSGALCRELQRLLAVEPAGRFR